MGTVRRISGVELTKTMGIFKTATALSVITVLFLTLAAPRLYRGYSEAEVRQSLQAATPGDTLSEKVVAAVDEGDIDGAVEYAALGNELGKPVSPEANRALLDAQGTFATIVRNAGDFAGAYITGEADSAAGLAGAVVSDLTVVGDVRDIISEGGKAAIGEDYSRFLLTLAGIGLAAEAATIATGGSSLVVKAAVSVLKVAKRTGNLTVEFTTTLTRLARVAAQRTPGPSTLPVPAGAVPLTRAAARAELAGTFANVSTMARNAGAADAVKLMRHVRTTADARNMATFTSRFGRRSRVVADLTGKTTLRAFRVAARGLRILIMFLWSLLAWIAGLIAIRLAKRALRGLLSLIRGAFMAVAVP